MVLLGDISKGALAIVVGKLLGLEDHWIVVPGAAAIVGHWNSVFAGFRGGDGLATLGGVMIALFPLHGFIGVVVAGTVALGSRKMPYTSLLCIVFGYLAIVILNLTYAGDAALTLGAGGIAAMVLAHAIRGHLRRRRSEDWVDGTPEREGLAP